MAAMWPSRMPTSPEYQGEPVPSMMCPLRTIASKGCAAAESDANNSSGARVPARIRWKWFTMQFLTESIIQLITQTSTNLPPDVRAAVAHAIRKETPGTQASQALGIIVSNIDMAVEDEGAICQDTGMPTFYRAHARGRESDPHQGGDSRGRRAKPRGAASCGPIPSIRSPAKTAATTSARRRR